jgi:hypothetical protein
VLALDTLDLFYEAKSKFADIFIIEEGQIVDSREEEKKRLDQTI